MNILNFEMWNWINYTVVLTSEERPSKGAVNCITAVGPDNTVLSHFGH